VVKVAANAGVGQADGDLDDLAAPMVQGDAGVVVVLDHNPPGGSFAVVLVDVRRADADIDITQVSSSLSFTGGFNPRAAAALDADADGDVIDPATGEARCLEINASNALEPCS
jgi:hypothetical protein